ncbi:hypothetical protein [Halorussus sp. MSC15.2]|uniref:hypothetical protein n=1 Tax=Halorussus sp. MSC15.2 TaxID=2283638 RepID=UPI0013D6C092|nr:hypothetical protein [Halorussus sp. MSC15.2]NEU59071.1 hypothetical protein [Halorussus sp. MSC15.2]
MNVTITNDSEQKKLATVTVERVDDDEEVWVQSVTLPPRSSDELSSQAETIHALEISNADREYRIHVWTGQDEFEHGRDPELITSFGCTGDQPNRLRVTLRNDDVETSVQNCG